MSWTTAKDLRAQLRRLWDRGVLLQGLVEEGASFPLRLSLKVPTSRELAERFEEARAWVGEISALPRIRIEWREVRHRVLGSQRVPESAWVDDLDSALEAIDRRREAALFRVLLDLTRARQPRLVPWLGRSPLQALELVAVWERLLAVVAYLQSHPRPRVYLRQVDIPGVHSKLLEAHRGVLSELLDLALPAEAIDTERTGIAQFAARYGFLDKPARLRFRVLDERLSLLPGARRPDVTLDAASFAALTLPVRRVFITENETNFLAFPPVPEAIVLFGAGYGWEALGRAQWLDRCSLHYWGDIDTHGFAILDQLRGRFAQVESFLMDRRTLLAHEALWGEEEHQAVHDLPRLNRAERTLFDDLRDNRIRSGLRLEQERIAFHCVEEALAALLHEDIELA